MWFIKTQFTVEEFLIGLCPHGGTASHAPEDHRIPSEEICRQSRIQLPTWRDATADDMMILKAESWDLSSLPPEESTCLEQQSQSPDLNHVGMLSNTWKRVNSHGFLFFFFTTRLKYSGPHLSDCCIKNATGKKKKDYIQMKCTTGLNKSIKPSGSGDCCLG